VFLFQANAPRAGFAYSPKWGHSVVRTQLLYTPCNLKKFLRGLCSNSGDGLSFIRSIAKPWARKIENLFFYLFRTQGDASSAYNKEGGEINILQVCLFLPTDEIAGFAYNSSQWWA